MSLFINRDPIEEAGGLNLYGFCGNDGIDNVDYMGNSWLSKLLSAPVKAFDKLWDNTYLKYSRKVAQDWDHGRQYVIMAVAIVASVFVGFEVALMVEDELVALEAGVTYAQAAAAVTAGWTAGTAGGALASLGGAIAGGAAGGFVSGTSLAAMSGKHLGQALEAGLKGAEYGALSAAITGGMTDLNSSFEEYTKVKPFTNPFKDWGTDLNDLRPIAALGLEGAVKNELLNKNPSSGFWSGIFSAAGSGFKLSDGNVPWDTAVGYTAGAGIVGGIGSMNKHGAGFMDGFWKGVSSTATSYLSGLEKQMPLAAIDLLGIAQKGIAAGAVSRFGRKTFAAGLFPGLGGEALSDGLAYMEGNPEKPPTPSVSGPANSAFKLLQPKTTKKGVTIPLDSLTGGSWANGANWGQLY